MCLGNVELQSLFELHKLLSSYGFLNFFNYILTGYIVIVMYVFHNEILKRWWYFYKKKSVGNRVNLYRQTISSRMTRVEFILNFFNLNFFFFRRSR